MPLTPTADQQGLCDSFSSFLSRNAPSSVLRKMALEGTRLDRDYWRSLVELGWISLLVSEERGGGNLSGNPYEDLALLADVSGRHVAPGPLIPANIVAHAIASTPGEALERVLAGMLDGSRLAVWAVAESSTFDLRDIQTIAKPTSGGYELSGTKCFVEGAPDADLFLVTARCADDLAHFLIEANAPGVSVRARRALDAGRSCGTVSLNEVRVDASARITPPGAGEEHVRRLLDIAVALQAAESVGVMAQVWEMTMEWVQSRVAFGRVIGSYQALKHRLAIHKLWFEASAGLVDGLTAALGAGDPDASRLASIAKVHVGETAVRFVSDAIQMHGGIGVTWEHDLHLYLRRASANRALYDGPAQHRDRLCTLAGL